MACEECTSAEVEVDFVLDGTAAVHQEDNGDLIIEGIAANTVLDRMDEAFEPGAFDEGIKAFMQNPQLVYHHQYDKPLGRVLELRPEGGTLFAKAVVRKPAAGSWAEDIYNRILVGDLKAFSVGGKWHRREGPDGRPRIWKADMAELSITPLPVNPSTLFEVAGKALGVPGNEDAPLSAEDEGFLARAVEALDRLVGAFEGKAAPTAEQRKKFGMAGGEFPIWHCGNGPGGVGAAKADIGRTKLDKAAVKAHIARRAKALGCPEKGKFDD